MTKPKQKSKAKAREWWVVVNQGGDGNIDPSNGAMADFDSKQDAILSAKESDDFWPHLGPHVAIKVREVKR